MRDPVKLIVTLVSSAALMTACGRKAVVEMPEPVSSPQTRQPTTAATPVTMPVATTQPVENTGTQRTALEERIYFDFDRADLSPTAQATLTTKAELLRSAPGTTLRIEGHTDERGSDEYNLALSNRRAAETKRFLVRQGVDAARLDMAGYGEEQPLESGHDERSWAQNRRAEFRASGSNGTR